MACLLPVHLLVGIVIGLYLLVRNHDGRICGKTVRYHDEFNVSGIVVLLYLLGKHQRVGEVAMSEERTVFCIILLRIHGVLEIIPIHLDVS